MRDNSGSGAGRFFSRPILAAAVAGAVGAAGSLPAQANLTQQDLNNVAAAVRAIDGRDYRGGLALRNQIRSALGRDMVTWYAAVRTDTQMSFADIVAFARRKPDWPWPNQLRRMAERRVGAGAPAALVISWYAKAPPKTFDGQVAAIDLLLRAGKRTNAEDLIKRSWANTVYASRDEKAFYERYKKYLQARDHQARMDYLLYRGKKRQAEQFMRLVALEPGIRDAANARLLMRSRRTRLRIGLINAALAKVPKTIRGSEDFLYDEMRWTRRIGRTQTSIQLLSRAPRKLNRPNHWWKERNVQVRHAIQVRNYPLAYRLAADHRQKYTKNEHQAEWLAGYIALRLLKDPQRARKHFIRATETARWAWATARVAYWRGRLAERLGDKESARSFYTTAVRFPTTFYGQLASAKIGRRNLTLLDDKSFARPNIANSESDVVQATWQFLRVGKGYYARAFALHAMVHHAGSPAEHVWLAKTIQSLTGKKYKIQTGVRLTKLAQRDGWALIWKGYPVIDLPADNTVEPALVYALIRQESEFMAHAKSWVGARGLMQLMHFTARMEARDLKVPYSLSRLTRDPAYNLRLGTVHMERLLKLYDGSYPLVLAAYNAGAHRVDRWLRYHGDPRTSKTVDWVDWIELIQFDETRGYVKRVLEAHTIYRLKLGAKVQLGSLSGHWQTPEKDYETVCKAVAARKKANGDARAAVGKVVPLAVKPKAPARSAKTAGKKGDRPDPFRLARKEKPDNLPGTPPC